MTTAAPADVAAQLATLSVGAGMGGPGGGESQALQPMKRPGFGTKGDKFQVLVNAFAVTPPKDLTCYNYDVKISPEADKRPTRINRDIWRALAETNKAFGANWVAYDGRALCYSPVKLDFGGEPQKQWSVDLPEADGGPAQKGNKFIVQLQYIGPVNLGALSKFVKGASVDSGELGSAIQALNIVLQHTPMMNNVHRGASFFPPPAAADRAASMLSKGLEIYRGFFTSLRPGPGGRVVLNIDLSSHPMRGAGNLHIVMLNFARGTNPRVNEADLAAGRLPPAINIALGRFLRGVQIIGRVPGPDGRPTQHRKITELSRTSALKSEFTLENGKKTNVAAFFKSHHGITLQHPDWPCVKVSKMALWPIELCSVKPGQKYVGRLDPVQTAEVLKVTTVKPVDRIPLLKAGINEISPRTGVSALTQWQIKVDSNLMEVTARKLRAPEVNYKKKVIPNNGTWDLRGQKFFAPVKIDRWMVFVFDNPQYFTLVDAQNAIMGLVSACQNVGIAITNPRPNIVHVNPREVPVDKIGDFMVASCKNAGMTTGPPQMLICFLNKKPCPEYSAIKIFGDTKVGCATQCLLISKIKRANEQYFSNVALKVNVKLSGTNSILGPEAFRGFQTTPTMVFGADVTHPAPGSLSPSVAAVVGTMDKNFALYGTRYQVQESRLETIERMDDMCHDLLTQFVAKNGRKPDTIIFFRDGVSEGQFAIVLAIEVQAIRVACQRLDRNYKPKLTFIVCGKRHHISMFPKDSKDADPKNGNVKAGTTIDTDVTSPFQFDWYTQSHASLLGTGRSCHYTVLVDDSKLSADVLQGFVYAITYCYARCTRSVSYATPAYYADRVCTRVSLYLANLGDDDNSTVMSGGSNDSAIRAARLAEARNQVKPTHKTHAQALYFM